MPSGNLSDLHSGGTTFNSRPRIAYFDWDFSYHSSITSGVSHLS